jgi:DNA-directed RNA polymerase specialized sigma24 family protein
MTGRDDNTSERPLDEFSDFMRTSAERLRIALTASFGVADGRMAAVDALSWAWELWDQVRQMANPVGYLYRVGQTAARRIRSRPIPITVDLTHVDAQRISPELVDAISGLSGQQRTVVMLVHAFGWTVRDVAAALDLAPSTVQTHSDRAWNISAPPWRKPMPTDVRTQLRDFGDELRRRSDAITIDEITGIADQTPAGMRASRPASSGSTFTRVAAIMGAAAAIVGLVVIADRPGSDPVANLPQEVVLHPRPRWGPHRYRQEKLLAFIALHP